MQTELPDLTAKYAKHAEGRGRKGILQKEMNETKQTDFTGGSGEVENDNTVKTSVCFASLRLCVFAPLR